jgi:F-type H+-transporting ATPase subunit alpha
VRKSERIRACLKQPEFAPVSVSEQIAILLALAADLFKPVPLEKMADAERVVREAAAEIPTEVRMRMATAAKLTDEDRGTIVQVVRRALEAFQR